MKCGTDNIFYRFFFGNPFTSIRLHSKRYAFIQFRLCTSHTSGSAFLLRYLSLCASADVAADEMTDETGGNGGSRWSSFHTEKPAVGVTLSSHRLCEPSWLVRYSLHGDRLSSSYFSFSKPYSAVIFNLFLSVELS